MNSSKRNVYLVDLGSGSDLNLLPLGFTLVGSYSAADPVLSAAYHFDYRFLRPPLETLVDDMPDPAVVALACYNWNIRGSLEVARRVKLRHPGAITVLGGCSVPNDHERIGVFLHQHPYVDILVRGEGEQIFSELLHQLLPGGDLHLLNGISFRDHEAPDAFVTTGAPGIIHDLTALPSPFLNGVMDRLLLRYRDQITGVLWETTRGCPYSCSFCYWGDSAMNKLRRHDLDRLRAEIEWIGRNQFSYIFATDPNFGILSKRDEAVAAMVVETKQKYGFPKQFGVNWSKNAGERILRVADILSEGGIGTTINTAVQSFHEPTLSAVKRLNISRDDMQMVKEALFAKGGSTMTEIILGLPMDTYESFVATINQAMSSQIGDNFIIYLCQLIDNTELASDSSREQYKIDGRLCRGSAQNRVYHDKSDDVEELIEVIVETSTMPIPDWRRAYVAGYCGTSIYRVGFFPINFLRYFHNVEPMDFIEFTIAELERDPVDFPTLSKGLQHVVTQQQMILDGIAEKMGIEGLEDVAINPDVAACAIFLYD